MISQSAYTFPVLVVVGSSYKSIQKSHFDVGWIFHKMIFQIMDFVGTLRNYIF